MKYTVSIKHAKGVTTKIAFATSEEHARKQAIEWEGIKSENIVAVKLVPDGVIPPCEKRSQYIECKQY